MTNNFFFQKPEDFLGNKKCSHKNLKILGNKKCFLFFPPKPEAPKRRPNVVRFQVRRRGWNSDEPHAPSELPLGGSRGGGGSKSHEKQRFSPPKNGVFSS